MKKGENYETLEQKWVEPYCNSWAKLLEAIIHCELCMGSPAEAHWPDHEFDKFHWESGDFIRFAAYFQTECWRLISFFTHEEMPLKWQTFEIRQLSDQDSTNWCHYLVSERFDGKFNFLPRKLMKSNNLINKIDKMNKEVTRKCIMKELWQRAVVLKLVSSCAHLPAVLSVKSLEWNSIQLKMFSCFLESICFSYVNVLHVIMWRMTRFATKMICLIA